MADPIRIFQIGRVGGSLSVALPASWALSHERVHVMFESSDDFGWHATVESSGGACLLSFPWYDPVDKMLRGDVGSELPDPALADGEWDDLEQGWWASVRVVGGDVFIAETDFDRLDGVPGTPAPQLMRPGFVAVSGVEIRWSRVARAAWDEAWEVARASCLCGAPAPVRRR